MSEFERIVKLAYFSFALNKCGKDLSILKQRLEKCKNANSEELIAIIDDFLKS